MPSKKDQKKAFAFLLERFRDQKPFGKEDLRAVTSWADTSLNTYWSKLLKPFFVLAHTEPKKTYRVSEAFRPYMNWEKFRRHITQVRGVSSDYTALVHDDIIVFEFFMPLTNEEHLRTSLDALFFRDAIMTRLRSVDIAKVEKYFTRPDGASGDQYLDEVANWIGDHFVGYSISHVNGRFRLGPVATLEQAAEIQKNGARYLVDETTAIVRFIFPCGAPRRRAPPLSAETFEDAIAQKKDQRAETTDEATKIRWAFAVLFVQSIVQVVNGEAEIWMVESGMRSRLHIWRIEGDEDEDKDEDEDEDEDKDEQRREKE